MYVFEPTIKPIVAVFIISLWPLGQTANGAVILESELRRVNVFADVFTGAGSDSEVVFEESAGDFSNFDESIEGVATFQNALAEGTAQQRSLISTTSISASGMVTGNSDVSFHDPHLGTVASTVAQSYFSVDFQVATPQFFDLSGIVSSSFSSGIPVTDADATLRNQDGSFNLSFSSRGREMTPFDTSGTLFPDTYSLFARANISAVAFGINPTVTGTAEFSLDFQVTPVPIPAAIWLFAFGLLGLIGIARKKRAA